MSGTAKCDAIRDALNGVSPAATAVPAMANARMRLAALAYSPRRLLATGVRKALIEREIAAYSDIIASNESAMAQAGTPASVTWADFNKCLWNKSGVHGSASGRAYLGRADALQLGMEPRYPLGGSLGSGAIWKDGDAPIVPLSVDYVVNPDLFVIIILVFLTLLVFALVKKQKHRPAAKTAQTLF